MVKEWRGGRTWGDTWTIVESLGRDTTTAAPEAAVAVAVEPAPERGRGCAVGLGLTTTFYFVCVSE